MGTFLKIVGGFMLLLFISTMYVGSLIREESKQHNAMKQMQDFEREGLRSVYEAESRARSESEERYRARFAEHKESMRETIESFKGEKVPMYAVVKEDQKRERELREKYESENSDNNTSHD